MNKNKKIIFVESRGKTNVFSSNMKKDYNLVVKIAYFPDWQVYIDGKESKIQVLDRGFMIHIPAGRHTVVVRFKDTKLRRVANLITLLALLFVSGVFIRKNGYMVKWLNCC